MVDNLVIRPAAPSASDSLAFSVRLGNTGTAVATQAAVVPRVDGVERASLVVAAAPGPVEDINYVVRGDPFLDLAAGTRSAIRGYYAPTYRSHGIGARLVRIGR